MLDKDSLFTGIIIGVIIPVVGYLVVEFIFNTLTSFGLMEYVTGGGTSKRMRTLALLGICCNLIPFNISIRNKWDDTMRGIVFPTLAYVVLWIYQFGSVLF